MSGAKRKEPKKIIVKPDHSRTGLGMGYRASLEGTKFSTFGETRSTAIGELIRTCQKELGITIEIMND